MREPIRMLVVAISLAIPLLPGAGMSLAAEPVAVVFAETGAEQSWTVPDDVTSIHVVLRGGDGGGMSGQPGGLGARVSGDLAVEAGAVLYVQVGGRGTSGGSNQTQGGFNGGGVGGEHAGFLFQWVGAGGGASDIRTVSRHVAGTLASRLMVAGGGGGAGIAAGSAAGGNAGAAGSGGGGGQAGTDAAGGVGGAGPIPGDGGTAGEGGAGASGFEGVGAGGGGGGGYYGGGGGSANPGGGGGGGSSFTGAATNASVALDTTRSPSVTITYEVGADPTPGPTGGADTGVVEANVTAATSATCIELSTDSVTFGEQRFGVESVAATPGVTVTSCSGTAQRLLARGTDATGTGATWSLVDDAGACDAGTLAIDDYHLKIRRSVDDVDLVSQLGTTNKGIAELAGGDQTTLEALLDMPCPGSTGAGQTMGLQIVFVVIEEE